MAARRAGSAFCLLLLSAVFITNVAAQQPKAPYIVSIVTFGKNAVVSIDPATTGNYIATATPKGGGKVTKVRTSFTDIKLLNLLVRKTYKVSVVTIKQQVFASKPSAPLTFSTSAPNPKGAPVITNVNNNGVRTVFKIRRPGGVSNLAAVLVTAKGKGKTVKQLVRGGNTLSLALGANIRWVVTAVGVDINKKAVTPVSAPSTVFWRRSPLKPSGVPDVPVVPFPSPIPNPGPTPVPVPTPVPTPTPTPTPSPVNSVARPIVARLSGANVVPPTGSNFTGLWQCLVPAGSNNCQWLLQLYGQGSINIQQIHLHNVATGEGTVVVDISGTADSVSSYSVGLDAVITLTGLAVLSVDLINNILAGRIYMNVHTTSFPNGEVQGPVLVQQALDPVPKPIDPPPIVPQPSPSPDPSPVPSPTPSPSNTPPRPISAVLSGANEVPPTNSNNTGTWQCSISGDALPSYTCAWTMQLFAKEDLNITALHLHKGAAGQEGPINVTLTPTFATSTQDGATTVVTLQGSFDASPELATAMLGSNTYVNVHSAKFPDGEIRGQTYFGQLPPPPSPSPSPSPTPASPSNTPNRLLIAQLSGASEVPPVMSNFTGTWQCPISGDSMSVYLCVWSLSLSGTGNLVYNASSFNNGTSGQNGPVISMLDPLTSNTTTVNGVTNVLLQGVAEVTSELLSAIQANQVYFNLQTQAFPAGELRGQVDLQLPAGAPGK